jgi:hypothetical protein
MTVAVRVGNDGQSASAAPGIDAADVSIVGVTVVGIIRVVVVVVGTAPPATGGGEFLRMVWRPWMLDMVGCGMLRKACDRYVGYVRQRTICHEF